MIDDRDIRAACDVRDLLQQAPGGDRATAIQLRRAEKKVRACLDIAPPLHVLDAWCGDRGLSADAAPCLMESGLPLLSLELGMRRAAQAAQPVAPDMDAVLQAAHAADAAMLATLKEAKSVCRRVIDELHLAAVPDIGTVVSVGRRQLELIEVIEASRLIWRDVDRGTLFSSALTGRPRYRGGVK